MLENNDHYGSVEWINKLICVFFITTEIFCRKKNKCISNEISMRRRRRNFLISPFRMLDICQFSHTLKNEDEEKNAKTFCVVILLPDDQILLKLNRIFVYFVSLAMFLAILNINYYKFYFQRD